MTTALKNQYEELIDNMMIEEVAGLDSELKLTLKGLDIEDKRIGILSILDQDRGLFKRIEKKLDSPEYFSKTEHIKSVVEMMRSYVGVGEVEKKSLGEVMTPISLVNDMLDTLPKEVWSNPNLKWLDPCGGCGIFSSVIIERLMTNLDISESDEDRYKHIVENMLYVSELQPKNMFLHLVTFDPRDEYDLNVYCGSSLDEGFDNHCKEVWGLDKFDVIVMNPPYQEQKEGNRKTQPLWDKFVVKTTELLGENGYLVAVHPSGWRNVDGVFKYIQNILTAKEILYLEIHNEKDGLNTFGAETRYDFYCLRNRVNNHFLTSVKGQSGVIEQLNLSEIEFIPNDMFNEFFKLIAKNNEEKTEILHSYSSYETRKPYMSNEEIADFKYPCIYTVKSGDVLNKLFSNTNKNGHFGIPKLIWSNFRISSAGSYVDDSGEFGLTQFSYAIIDSKDNLPKIKIAFDSKKFRELMESCAVSDMSINRKVIATFRKDFWKEFI